MADEELPRTARPDEEHPRSGPRSRWVWARLKRHRLRLAGLLPVCAMAAVFVAEPFAGMQSVDQPVPPATAPATTSPVTSWPAPTMVTVTAHR